VRVLREERDDGGTTIEREMLRADCRS